jgi:hypothetical protein
MSGPLPGAFTPHRSSQQPSWPVRRMVDVVAVGVTSYFWFVWLLSKQKKQKRKKNKKGKKGNSCCTREFLDK